ncbi:MAG TPA: alpha/beta fold hydrolase [Candidatus Paceibacterota bacterium]|nr:alpha/beta fold hydrolase [Candidatus Paceibacterota bacterium]
MKKSPPQHALRTRFARDIVCEFLPPARKSRRVIIICPGMPGYPSGRGGVLAALAARGYWVFVPRYRGSWESGGKFLARSPHEDVLEVIAGLPRGFVDLYSGKKHRIEKPELYLIGGSFGGPAVLLAARDKRVKKAVAISAVADWRRQEGTTESIPFMARSVPRAFGEAYRADPSAWKKLANGKFYNPSAAARSLPGEKLLLFHARDDEVVPFAPAKKLAEEIGAEFIAFKKGGHGGASLAAKPKYWRRIERFFKAH